MDQLQRVMIIRHGEKPLVKHDPPFGVTADGEQDWESLTVRGWLRASGLALLFTAPQDGSATGTGLATPSLIYASKPREPGVALPAEETASKSKRPLQTITPLAAKLGLTPDLSFGKGDEDALAAEVLRQSRTVLICWQHEAIYDIARAITAAGPPKAALPVKWPGERFDVIWILDPPEKGKQKWKFTLVPQRLLPGDETAPFS